MREHSSLPNSELQRTREQLITQLQAEGISNQKVLAAMANVPRHLFVEAALVEHAYEDVALPIGHSQTISQPYMVARMTELLLTAAPLRRVLEIGTGSGYQAAVLAQLTEIEEIHSVERIHDLWVAARKRLRDLNLLDRVHLHHADGFQGWSLAAPYDAILVTAAPLEVPSVLLSQLAEGGRLIIPVGEPENQTLTMVTRQGSQFTSQALDPVRFVPLLSGKE